MRADVRLGFQSAFDGCYDADRAAALAGIPESTVYAYARRSVVVPSVSATRPMCWSYANLMGLRIVYWLRQRRVEHAASLMPEVGRALERLQSLRLDIWSEPEGGRTPLLVGRRGRITIGTPGDRPRPTGQTEDDALDLLAPFEAVTTRGPDLVRPRPHLRIVPGKVAGEPPLDGARLTTVTLAALAARGYEAAAIARLYPDVDLVAIREAIEFEQVLAAKTQSVA